MRYSWKQLTKNEQAESRSFLPGGIFGYLQSLSPGDRFIVYVLGFLLGAGLLSGLYAFERQFLVVEPAYGGSFTEGVVGHPRFVNPLLALSDADRDAVQLTFAGLMGAAADGTLVPVLAESYTVSEDGRIYTFVLREKAVFSDGSPVTADDVVYTVTKAQDPGLKSPLLASWANIKVEAVDARTVRFTLPRAYAPFLEETTLGILPARLWRSVTNEEFPFSPLMTEPVGAGPFAVEHVKRDKSGVVTGYTLRAFEDYVLGRPYLDRIRLVFLSTDADRAALLKKGTIDSTYGVPTDHSVRASYARIFGAFYNATENPVFADPAVRRALSIAIDRTKITDQVLGGYATPVMGPVPPGSGIEVTPVIAPEDRVREAAGILEAAGWRYSTETRAWQKANVEEPLRLTLRTSNVPELRLVAQQIQADWTALGVPTSLELYEPTDLTQSVIRPRKYDVLLFGMVVGRDRDLYAFWHSQERSDPGLNIALYSNSVVDGLLERARTEQDLGMRLSDLATIERQIASDYPAAFTHAPEFVYAIPGGIQGVALPQITSPSDRFVEVAKWYRYTQEVWPFLATKR